MKMRHRRTNATRKTKKILQEEHVCTYIRAEEETDEKLLHGRKNTKKRTWPEQCEGEAENTVVTEKQNKVKKPDHTQGSNSIA